MKKIHLFLSLASFCLLVLLFVPQISQAESYSQGDLLKSETSQGVYYIAADNKAYKFPNLETYHSWYSSLADVKVINKAEFSKIKKSKEIITIRPATRLIKFASSNKVYVLDTGANLRWLDSEATAKSLYGDNWTRYILILPTNRINDYTFAEAIKHPSDFKIISKKQQANNISVELKARKIIAETVKTSDSLAEPLTLKSLSENLKSGFSPKFDPEVVSYTITAEYYEESLSLRPMANKDDAEILVNSIPTPNSSEITFKLNEGENQIVIKISRPGYQTKTYTITAIRVLAKNNNLLKSLSENLEHNLDPKFDPRHYSYTLLARYYEKLLELKASVDDKDASLLINRTPANSGKTYSFDISDKDTITIYLRVTAQSGRSRLYTLNIKKEEEPDENAVELASLETDLDALLYPNFNPDKTEYRVKTSLKDKVKVTAKAKHADASVLINGKKTTSQTINLYYGDNEIKINVVLPNGANKEYTLIVNRAETAKVYDKDGNLVN